MKLYIYLFAFIFSLTFADTATGQIKSRISAEEINNQKTFLEANKHKLLGEYKDAVRLYNEVLDKDKQNSTAAYELSRILILKNEYAKALDAVNLALRIDYKVTWYYMLKADILEAQMEFDKAIEQYEMLTKLNPAESYYYEHLHELYLKNNQLDKALVNLENYEAAAGITESVIRNKFDVYNELGQPDKSLAEVDKLILLYPENLEYLQLAAAYSKQVEKDDLALEYYKKIIELDPDDSRANLALAGGYKSDGNDLAYLRSIKDIISNPSINLDVKIQELIPYLEKVMVERDTALELTLFDLLRLLDTNHPGEAKIQSMYGDLYFATDQLEDARKSYENTIALNDGVYTVWDQLLYIVNKQEDWTSLVKVSENAMDVFPNQGSIYYYNAIGLVNQNDFDGAESSLAQALIMSSKDKRLQLDILSMLGYVYAQLGKMDKSKSTFEKAGSFNKNDALLLERKGDVADLQNDTNKAIQFWKEAMENGGNKAFLQKKIDNLKIN